MPNSPVVTGVTDIGRIRKRNEDSLSLLPELGVAVVADGMGGHPGGDVASRIAADTTVHLLGEAQKALNTASEALMHMRGVMESAIQEAHAEIRVRGTAAPELVGMGTTLTAMVVNRDTDTYVLGHVGDSRAYLYRAGTLTQLTRDDTWVQDRIERGDITAEAARTHPYGHLLTQCLGLEDAPSPQVLDGRVDVGDAYLLCTDGLVGMLEDSEMERILGEHLDPDNEPDGDEPSSPIQALIDAANAGGGHDNITAVLIRIAARVA